MVWSGRVQLIKPNKIMLCKQDLSRMMRSYKFHHLAQQSQFSIMENKR